MSTVPHPAAMFTEQQASAFNTEIKRVLDARLKRQKEVASKPPKPLKPIVYKDWFEAECALDDFEMQPDVTKQLADLYEEQNREFQLEEELCKILSSDPTD